MTLMAGDKRPAAGQQTNSPAGQLTNSPAGQLTNSPAGQLTNSPAGQPTNSPAGLAISYLTSGVDAGGATQSPSSAVQLTGLISSGQMNSFPTLSGIQMASPVSNLQLPGGANSFYSFQLPFTNSSSSLSDFQLTGNSSSSHSNIQLLGGGSSSSLSNVQLTSNSSSSHSNIQLTLGSSNLQLSDSSAPSFTNIQFPPGTVITLDTGQVLDWSQVSGESCLLNVSSCQIRMLPPPMNYIEVLIFDFCPQRAASSNKILNLNLYLILNTLYRYGT